MAKMPLTINELDDDVLVRVFEELAEIDRPGDAGKNASNIHFRLGWIVASHVNRRWRHLLISLSSFWGHIISSFPYSPAAWETLYQRAGGAGLDLTYNPKDRQQSELDRYVHRDWLPFVFEHIERARTLRGFFNTPHYDRLYSLLSNGTFPHLVDVNIAQRFSMGRPDAFKEPFYLDAPNLRVTTLSGIRCRFTSTHLRSLQYLGGFDGTPDWTGGNLLGVLRCTPLLETLHCGMDYSPAGMQRDSSNTRPVRLPYLKTLCVAWYHATIPDDARLFLDDLSLPPSCTFHLVDGALTSEETGWRRTLEVCSARWSQVQYNAVALRLSESSSDGRMWIVNTFHTRDCHAPLHRYISSRTASRCCTGAHYAQAVEQGRQPLALGVFMRVFEIQGHDNTTWRPEVVFRDFTSRMRQASITHLVLNNLDENDHEFVDEDDVLRAALQPFLSVTSLFLISTRIQTLRQLFLIADISLANEWDQVLPALRDVTIGCEGTQVSHPDTESCHEWWRCVLGFLDARKRAGLPIHTLRLCGLWNFDSWRATEDIDSGYMQRARELVEELIDDRTSEDVNH